MEQSENENQETNDSLPSKQKLRWLYKHSDDLANFFGGMFVLTIGFIFFCLVTLFLDDKSEWRLENLGFYITLSLIIGTLLLYLMLHFARKLPVIQKISEDDEHENYSYVISEWSLKTLQAAGVPGDIIEYLEELRGRSKAIPKELKMTLNPKSVDNWLEKLSTDLGKTRVGEFREIILKYTRRNVSK